MDTKRPKINTAIHLLPMEDDFTHRIQKQAKAEAAIVKSLTCKEQPMLRERFFDSKDKFTFFVVVTVTSSNLSWPQWPQKQFIGVLPEEFIGLGDGEFRIASEGQHCIIKLNSNEEEGLHDGEVMYRPDIQLGRQGNLEYNCHEILSSTIRLQRNEDGILFPMLALFAQRLSVLHEKHYTIEMAAEEVYDLELESRPDYMDTLHMPDESWVTTVPQATSTLMGKYGIDFAEYSGLLGNKAAVSIVNDSWTRILPLSFYKFSMRDFAITFPMPQTSHVLLDNLDNLQFEGPVFLTEYSALCYAHNQGIFCEHNQGPFALCGIYGEKMIPKIVFSSPGKTYIYLEILADEDKNYERAHRVALKTFTRAYEQGVRNFTVMIWPSGEIIPMDKLMREAVEKGYLEAPCQEERKQRLEGYLDNWPKPVDQGKAIVGRVIKAGRCALLYADPGVGKTLFSQAVSTVAYQQKSLDNGCFQYTWKSNRPCRILYVQNEMGEDEFKVRQKSLDAFLNVSETKVEYHTPEGSLTDLDEQIAVLKKLETLDPEGKYQWIVWLDSVKTVMPDAEVGNTFTKKVSPFIRLLKDVGCSVVVLHHSNLQGKESGGTNINVTNNYKIHLERKSEQNGSYCVQITVEKGRDLTGNEGASAMWSWTVDAAKVISEFNSTYEDDNGASMQSAQSTQMAAPVNPPTSSNPLDALPKTWDELKALPEQEQKIALFNLWNSMNSIPMVAEHLGISSSTIEKRMKVLNVKEETKREYLRMNSKV